MLQLPPVIAGTSSLGNLYTALSPEKKKQIVAAYLNASPRPAVFDSAGKYGAGMALEALGRCLKELGVPPEEVMISNKLGWIRTPLTAQEPTFEPGVWKNLQHNARQQIGYHQIMAAIRFALAIPGIHSIALSSSSPERTRENLQMTRAHIPEAFWGEMKARGLLPANATTPQ